MDLTAVISCNDPVETRRRIRVEALVTISFTFCETDIDASLDLTRHIHRLATIPPLSHQTGERSSYLAVRLPNATHWGLVFL